MARREKNEGCILIKTSNTKLLNEVMQHPEQTQKMFVGIQTLDQSLKDADRNQTSRW